MYNEIQVGVQLVFSAFIFLLLFLQVMFTKVDFIVLLQ